MGPAYWIPAFWVPALLVTHYITYVAPLKYWTGDARRALPIAAAGSAEGVAKAPLRAASRFDQDLRRTGTAGENPGTSIIRCRRLDADRAPLEGAQRPSKNGKSGSLDAARSRSKPPLCLEAPLEQARRVHALRPGGERVGRAAPAQLVHVAEQRRVGPQRREMLEQQRELAALAEHRRRKLFDRAVPVQAAAPPSTAPMPGDARIAVGRVADEREEVGNQRRARRRTSRARRRHRGSSCRCGRPARRGRRGRTAPDPCRASRCRPSPRARRRRRCAPRRRARRRPRARSSARRRRPSRRAPPPADGTARAAPARCPSPVL